MRRAAACSLLGSFLGLLVLGCPPPDEKDRLPPLNLGGEGTGLAPTTGGATGGAAGSTSTGGGTGGSGTNTGGSTGRTTTLLGDVFEAFAFNTASDRVVDIQAHSGSATVVAQGRADDYPEVSVAAQGEVELTDVLESDGTWVRVTPTAVAFMAVLHQVDTTDDVREALLVMQRALLVPIETAVAATTGAEVDPERGQILLRVVDDQVDGLAGAVVAQAGADEVIYNNQNQWSTSATETDDSGLVWIFNVPATAANGSAQSVTIDRGTTNVTRQIPVWPDTVTIVDVLLN